MSADPSPSPRPAGAAPAAAGPVLRPLVLCAALYAAGLIAVWVPWFLGFISLDVDIPPVAWHAHELLFGFVPAAIAAVLPVAGPGRTGCRPGRWPGRWMPAGLVAAWLAGRLGVAASPTLGPLATALAALLFPLALAALAGREIAAGNRRILTAHGVLCVLIGAQILFHWELWRFGQSVCGTRLAVAAMVTPVMLAGGWGRSDPAGPHPIGRSSILFRLDRLAAGLGILALTAWVLAGRGSVDRMMRGTLLLSAGIALSIALPVAFARRPRPFGQLCGMAAPFTVTASVTRAFVPAGFLAAAWASFTAVPAYDGVAVHAWTAGAVGGMMLAAADRSRPVRPLSWPTAVIPVAVTVGAVTRIAAALAPQQTMLLVPLSGIAWIIAFLLFGIACCRSTPMRL
ncbi:NnrS family protein [Azospirillum sp. YIM B02556]|uniref:NnrS family protein n=1 Tax=Azospirillum endophyticum TaxID=2800326 RepID=A0ABS1EZW1_9PROT|nr:NnrS family protein [Azospirillum endophyticum]MBK1836700.1 NnrS family protein [Azospirillum endophyticum]